MNRSARPPFSVYRYASATEFLVDVYQYLHDADPGVTYEAIAEACGFRSRTLARNLIKGIHPAKEVELRALAKVFGQTSEEADFLVVLFAFGKAKETETSRTLFLRLLDLQKVHAPEVRPFREVEVATSVLHMTLTSVTELPAAPSDPVAIAALLKGRYSPAEIASALEELVLLGYVLRDPATGRLKSAGKHLKKYDQNFNYFLRNYHREAMKLSVDAFESEPASERYNIGSSFVVNGKVFPRIIQKVNAFVENLMSLEGMAGESDTVIQLNLQLLKMGSLDFLQNEPGLSADRAERVLAKNPHSSLRADPSERDLNPV